MNYEQKKRLIIDTLNLTPEQFEAMTMQDTRNERLNKLTSMAINQCDKELEQETIELQYELL
ncbi:hypothetical protein [Lentilactobacillus sunkii]|uniref:Uncharacterized protein n=1 Tax=Lentilactobacillus sunkii DSM 19904 TaxID=1423808 RepID=A0A0R1KW90_9LACO|nr:hypothetical protein [Lentilactobacillus sunkii]KRK87528.1 hypothetical protein FD17_GL000926 [Lentilactobacillus sunkii DSM 19904]